MNESPRIASHCVLPQSYPVFAYRLLADAAEPFMLIRVSHSSIPEAFSSLHLALTERNTIENLKCKFSIVMNHLKDAGSSTCEHVPPSASFKWFGRTVTNCIFCSKNSVSNC